MAGPRRKPRASSPTTASILRLPYDLAPGSSGVAGAGAAVALSARNLDQATGAAREVGGSLGGRTLGVRADVTSAADVRAMVDAVLAAFGRLDILVNNAGITRDNTMKRMDRKMWDDVIDTNLGSCFNLCKLVWEDMSSRKFGRIVNIGSINGQAGQYGQVNYAAAKSGIHGFTKALAQEVASRGITVNCVAPGLTRTSVTQNIPAVEAERLVGQGMIRRMAEPSETAAAIAFFLREDAGFLTGEMLSVSGGIRPHL